MGNILFKMLPLKYQLMKETEKKKLISFLKELQEETLQQEITRESSSTVDCCSHIIETLNSVRVACSTKKKR